MVLSMGYDKYDVPSNSAIYFLVQQQQTLRERKWKLRRIPFSLSPSLIFIIFVLPLFTLINDTCTRYTDGNQQRKIFTQVSAFIPPLVTRTAHLRSDSEKISSSSGLPPQSLLLSSSLRIGNLFMVSGTATANATLMMKSNSSSSSHQNTTEHQNNDENKPSKPSGGPVRSSGIVVRKKFISPEELDQLLDRVDIVALIESYGLPRFQRTSSSNAKCLCPFHDDRNPSLQISGERGIYKCFSCGAGGSALKFVREYSERYPEDNGSPLSFIEAVQALQEFADATSITRGSPRRRDWQGFTGSTSIKRANSKKSSLIGTTSRERILHANLFAAAYFEENLFKLVSAGQARMHLRSRGVLPTTVKAFAIGFAPESYFSRGERRQQQRKESWGEGSLVNRLRDEGFTPQEILDAGLAILTKKGKEQQNKSSSQNFDVTKKNCDEDGNEVIQQQHQHQDFSTIMDRFRRRLVVPIFDAKGTHVLGFGGRTLEMSGEPSSNFKAAKYLNSPVSLVFQKKELLFGQHMVDFEVAIDASASSSESSVMKTGTTAQRRPRSLIIVEGYMDAIALWQAGVKETVASMGTALTQEQLLAAASVARQSGGRIVLCLDNDNAGVAAVVRLCIGSDPILLSVTEKSNVEFFVANLPESVKDPADFLEEHRGLEGLDEKFRVDVIDEAIEWSQWHMNSMVAAYNPSAGDGEDGSFGEIFDRLASFLSVFEDVDDRMKKAAFIAPKLADLVDRNQKNEKSDINRVEASSTTRLQLASNLVERASNVAHSRAMNAQMKYELSSGSTEKGPIISKSLEISQDIALADGMKNKVNVRNRSQTPRHFEPTDDDPSKWRQQQSPMQRQRAQINHRNAAKRLPRPMTNHIAGIGGNQFDEEWLGVTKDKHTNERIPLRYELTYIAGNQKYVGPESSVRFNKNNYHGTWTTPDATAAGYVATSSSKGLDFLEKGTSSLIESNKAVRSLFVEDFLLSILVRFAEARTSLNDSIRVTKASGFGGHIQWSAPEKEWLFKCLIEEIIDIPEGIVGIDDLPAMRSYLSKRPDAFPGAFSSIAKQDDHSYKVNDKMKSSSTETMRYETEKPIRKENGNDSENVTSHEGDMEFPFEQVTRPLDSPMITKIPKIPVIPAIGEEWSDSAQIEGYAAGDMPDFGDDAMYLNGFDDSFMDSIGPIKSLESELDGEALTEKISPDENATENTSTDDSALAIAIPTLEHAKGNSSIEGSENVLQKAALSDENRKSEIMDVNFVVAEEGTIVKEGTLDRLFMNRLETYDIFSKFYADEDTMTIGSNENKAKWASQDLYTILQFTSVLKRVEAGRKYMEENGLVHFNDTISEGSESSIISKNSTIPETVNRDLLEYCSSRAFDRGLRRDLQRLRTLTEKSNQATNRILAMMGADFTDRSAEIRGYSWLGNVLKFNEVKMVEWNDIIESKENFRPSHEGLEDLKDIIYSDWNELSDPDEMYEFDKSVDLNHRSHFTHLVIDRPDSESTKDFTERVEDEWDLQSWDQEHDKQQDIEGGDFERYDDKDNLLLSNDSTEVNGDGYKYHDHSYSEDFTAGNGY